jgi:hypothetical protein
MGAALTILYRTVCLRVGVDHIEHRPYEPSDLHAASLPITEGDSNTGSYVTGEAPGNPGSSPRHLPNLDSPA